MEENKRKQENDRSEEINKSSEQETQQSSNNRLQGDSDMQRSTHETRIGERGTSGLGQSSLGTTTMRSASDQTQGLNDSGSMGRTKTTSSKGRSGQNQGNNELL